jgi:hypothetical protein
MDTSPVPPQKKGLGGLAWLGIGCGALLVIIAVVVIGAGVFFGPKLKKFAEEAQKNPTRMAASTAVTVSAGTLEMAAEDDVNKRYTIREKRTGKLTTFYWNAKKNAPESVEGDFSAIPADANPPAEPAPKSEAAPESAPKGVPVPN